MTQAIADAVGDMTGEERAFVALHLSEVGLNAALPRLTSALAASLGPREAPVVHAAGVLLIGPQSPEFVDQAIRDGAPDVARIAAVLKSLRLDAEAAAADRDPNN
jgi:hypothetical protein